MYQDHAHFVSIDDKHRIKVGEPGSPVAAVERMWKSHPMQRMKSSGSCITHTS